MIFYLDVLSALLAVAFLGSMIAPWRKDFPVFTGVTSTTLSWVLTGTLAVSFLFSGPDMERAVIIGGAALLAFALASLFTCVALVQVFRMEDHYRLIKPKVVS